MIIFLLKFSVNEIINFSIFNHLIEKGIYKTTIQEIFLKRNFVKTSFNQGVKDRRINYLIDGKRQ